MTIPFAPDAPSTPICRSAEDGQQPCRFATSCPETRQRRHHYAPGGPLRGMACWAFDQLTAKFGNDEQAERAAIAAEGNQHHALEVP